MNIQIPKPKAPPKIKHRPRTGAAKMRGFLVLTRLFHAYWNVGYFPIREIKGQYRRDLLKAMRYIEAMGAWSFWKRMDRRGKK